MTLPYSMHNAGLALFAAAGSVFGYRAASATSIARRWSATPYAAAGAGALLGYHVGRWLGLVPQAIGG